MGDETVAEAAVLFNDHFMDGADGLYIVLPDLNQQFNVVGLAHRVA